MRSLSIEHRKNYGGGGACALRRTLLRKKGNPKESLYLKSVEDTSMVIGGDTLSIGAKYCYLRVIIYATVSKS